MKQILYIFTIILLASCNNKKPAAAEYSTTPTGLNGLQSQSTSVPATTDTTNKADGNVTLNPAHGQPGHDCNIAVGAPLNASSMPAKPITIEQTNTAQPVAAQPAAAGQKLNPAHGQPGHK